ncbi:MAG: type 4a pilus biogenesis protein PilO [Patescibacteria group bacterium]|nr:type 4a pilus biogenesis protein PilO [Patescibacteria group bacterium]
MATKAKKSAKQIQVDKTNTTIVLIVSIAAVITAFSLVSVKALLSQHGYQNRVITAEQKSLKVAKADLVAVDGLNNSYNAFKDSPTNIIGGISKGSGPQDGSNPKIILDALPSQYDFPAMITGLANLLSTHGFKADSVSGIDDAAQADAATSTSPQPVDIPFQFSVTGSYNSVKDLSSVLERSVRPISVQTMQLTSNGSNVNLSITAKTYFQPGKNLSITPKVIK